MEVATEPESAPVVQATAPTAKPMTPVKKPSSLSREEAMKDDSRIMKGGDAEKAADFANYFISYAYLYHQKQMLTDHRRMSAYHAAIMGNPDAFKDKVVIDVGTGTGVLAVWAAKAGAARVIAVEFTDMATHAKTVVQRNGVADVVEVVQGSAEDLSDVEPHSVDIIVSEWMGYFLLRESMLDSLLRVREKYLKPSGAMYPSHATMYWALVHDEHEREGRFGEYDQAMHEWSQFTYETRQYYDLDLTCLAKQYDDEQRGYYLLSSTWAELKAEQRYILSSRRARLKAEQIISRPVEVYKLDLKTCTFDQVKGVPDTPFRFEVESECRVSGFAGWFTTDFKGTKEEPLASPALLSTGPEVGYTHWGQQVFHLVHPLDLGPGDRVEGRMNMIRQSENQRMYDVEVSFHVLRGGIADTFVSHKYQIP